MPPRNAGEPKTGSGDGPARSTKRTTGAIAGLEAEGGGSGWGNPSRLSLGVSQNGFEIPFGFLNPPPPPFLGCPTRKRRTHLGVGRQDELLVI